MVDADCRMRSLRPQGKTQNMVPFIKAEPSDRVEFVYAYVLRRGGLSNLWIAILSRFVRASGCREVFVEILSPTSQASVR